MVAHFLHGSGKSFNLLLLLRDLVLKVFSSVERVPTRQSCLAQYQDKNAAARVPKGWPWVGLGVAGPGSIRGFNSLSVAASGTRDRLNVETF